MSIYCPKCKTIPQYSIETGGAFKTHICYQRCGFVFWTLRQCPHCQFPQKTILLSKPNFGQLITCSNCHKKMYYFRCPKKSCQALFYKNAQNYQMGLVKNCQTCHIQYRTIGCSCGGQINLPSQNKIIEGYDINKCQCCNKSIIYTICTNCHQPQYHPERLQIGDKIRCALCLNRRHYVPCPRCGRSTTGKKFSFCEMIKCDFCPVSFQYSKCPFGCGVNYQFTQYPLGPIRSCFHCKQKYFVINCKKCQQSIYLQDLELNIGRIDQCPYCQMQIRFYRCQCNIFTVNDTKCSKTSCPKPKTVINAIEQREKNKFKNLQSAQYQQDECKLCCDKKSIMMNQVCGHLMMCQICYNNFKKVKNTDIFPCPICKAIGRYYKFREPIYA